MITVIIFSLLIGLIILEFVYGLYYTVDNNDNINKMKKYIELYEKTNDPIYQDMADKLKQKIDKIFLEHEKDISY